MRYLALTILLLATTLVTACMDPKLGQYPPSAMMERDSMPDKIDRVQNKQETISQNNNQ